MLHARLCVEAVLKEERRRTCCKICCSICASAALLDACACCKSPARPWTTCMRTSRQAHTRQLHCTLYDDGHGNASHLRGT